MTLPIKPPIFEMPPAEYERAYMIRLIKKMESTFVELNAAGPLHANRVNISDLPTSATGLAVGDLWNDTGTVKVKT